MKSSAKLIEKAIKHESKARDILAVRSEFQILFRMQNLDVHNVANDRRLADMLRDANNLYRKANKLHSKAARRC